ncbi:hypothetical protein OIV83_005743 [Microbotryomycetes sp. JL201]|nr:hypothetical protein OIV83_005743 [Microbotryomycetes sp. JL201]
MPRAAKRRRDDDSSDDSFKVDGADESDELASSGEEVQSVQAKARRAPRASTSKASSRGSSIDTEAGEPLTKEQDAVMKRKVRLFYAARPSRARIGSLRQVAEERREAYKLALSKMEDTPPTTYERKTDRRFRISEGDTSLRYEFSKDLPLVHESNAWLKLWREQFEWDHKWPRFSTLVGVACKLLEDGDWPTEQEFDKALSNTKRRRKSKPGTAKAGLEPIKNPADVSVQHQAEIKAEGRVALYLSFGAKVLGRKFLLTSTTTHFRPPDPDSAEYGAWEGLCHTFLQNPAAVVHGTIEPTSSGDFQMNIDELGFFSLSGLGQQSKDKIRWMFDTLEVLVAPLRHREGPFYLRKEEDGLWRLKKGPAPRRTPFLYPLAPTYTGLTTAKKEYKPPGDPPASLEKLDPSLTAGIRVEDEQLSPRTDREQAAAEPVNDADPAADPSLSVAEGVQHRLTSLRGAPVETLIPNEQIVALARQNVIEPENVQTVEAVVERPNLCSSSRVQPSLAKSSPNQIKLRRRASPQRNSGRPQRNAVVHKPVKYLEPNECDGTGSSSESESDSGAADEKVVMPKRSRRAVARQSKAADSSPAKGMLAGQKRPREETAEADKSSEDVEVEPQASPKEREAPIDDEILHETLTNGTPIAKKAKRAPRKSATTATQPITSRRAARASTDAMPNTVISPRARRRSAPGPEPEPVADGADTDPPASFGFAPPPPASFFRTNAVLSPFKSSKVVREPGSMLIDFETGKKIV